MRVTEAVRSSPGGVEKATLTGPVLVVGTGLIGCSVALALARTGVGLHLQDIDPGAAGIAGSLTGGSLTPPKSPPQLVVVATPPAEVAGEVAAALRRYPGCVVTDVGSVKLGPLSALQATGLDLSRYVGSHPMAGSERSGPLAASADLFEGRAWAVTPRPDCDSQAVAVVEALVRACGATVVSLGPAGHDEAVARVSHLPHLLAALVAARLADAPIEQLALSGQGLRDVTRVAAGDPGLWRQIVSSNAEPLAVLLHEVREDLDGLLQALEAGSGEPVQRLLASGVRGTARIPGKHGGPVLAVRAVVVSVPDEPGALARLFADIGRSGLNVEDLRIDHDPGRPFGQVEVVTTEGTAEVLVAALRDRGWRAHR